MRREDGAACVSRATRERSARCDHVERVGVEDDRNRRGERGAEQLPCRVGLAMPPATRTLTIPSEDRAGFRSISSGCASSM